MLESKVKDGWKKYQKTRHPDRIRFFNLVEGGLFNNFSRYRLGHKEDPALIAGFAEFEGQNVMVIGQQKPKGDSLEEAKKVTNRDVAKALDGLPPIKMHCSNLAADAVHKAIDDYEHKFKPKKHRGPLIKKGDGVRGGRQAPKEIQRS